MKTVYFGKNCRVQLHSSKKPYMELVQERVAQLELQVGCFPFTSEDFYHFISMLCVVCDRNMKLWHKIWNGGKQIVLSWVNVITCNLLHLPLWWCTSVSFCITFYFAFGYVHTCKMLLSWQSLSQCWWKCPVWSRGHPLTLVCAHLGMMSHRSPPPRPRSAPIMFFITHWLNFVISLCFVLFVSRIGRMRFSWLTLGTL